MESDTRTSDSEADDRAAIENLVFSYASLIDSGDLEGLADLFEHAGLGESRAGPLLRGRDAILELYRSTVRIYPDGTPRTKHVTTNVRIELAQDRNVARASSYFNVMQATEELPLQTIVAGCYSDRFEKEAGAWHFSERRFSTDLIGDMSRHMLRGEWQEPNRR